MISSNHSNYQEDKSKKLPKHDMENSDVVYFGYEKSCVDEASDDRHCLDEHYELSKLQGSILF